MFQSSARNSCICMPYSLPTPLADLHFLNQLVRLLRRARLQRTTAGHCIEIPFSQSRGLNEASVSYVIGDYCRTDDLILAPTKELAGKRPSDWQASHQVELAECDQEVKPSNPTSCTYILVFLPTLASQV